MSNVLAQKLTFDEQRRRAFHVGIAVSCRKAAAIYPALKTPLRQKMRRHALQAREKVEIA